MSLLEIIRNKLTIALWITFINQNLKREINLMIIQIGNNLNLESENMIIHEMEFLSIIQN